MSIVDKINALMAKAESTTFEPERDAFLAKAFELMEKNAIDEATLSAASGGKVQEKIEKRHFTFRGSYAKAETYLAYLSAEATGLLKAWTVGGFSGNLITICVVGHESDLSTWEAIHAGLSMQSKTAVKNWVKGKKYDAYWTRCDGNQKTRERAAFLTAFASAAANKIKDAKSVSSESHTAGNSLVLINRKDALDPYIPSSLRSTRSRRTSVGRSADSYASGRAAGERASIGQTSFGSGSRQLASR